MAAVIELPSKTPRRKKVPAMVTMTFPLFAKSQLKVDVLVSCLLRENSCLRVKDCPVRSAIHEKDRRQVTGVVMCNGWIQAV